jgi:hypothetical protein
MLERAENLDDLTDRNLARRLAVRCPIDPDLLPEGEDLDAWYREQCGVIRRMLQEPGIRSIFDGESGFQEEDSGSTVIRREFPLVIRGQAGVRIGIIDRLVLRLGPAAEDGIPKVIGASIIDFKTDRPGDGSEIDQTEFLARHDDQVKVYRAAIQDRYGLDPGRVRACLIRVDDALEMVIPPR